MLFFCTVQRKEIAFHLASRNSVFFFQRTTSLLTKHIYKTSMHMPSLLSIYRCRIPGTPHFHSKRSCLKLFKGKIIQHTNRRQLFIFKDRSENILKCCLLCKFLIDLSTSSLYSVCS